MLDVSDLHNGFALDVHAIKATAVVSDLFPEAAVPEALHAHVLEGAAVVSGVLPEANVSDGKSYSFFF